MMSKELRAAAESIKSRPNESPPHYSAHALADYALSTVREDDDELVTWEWCEAVGLSDSSITFRSQKRYEICRSVRIVFNACVGGWAPAELWVGGGEVHVVKNPTRGQVRRLCEALGIDLKDTRGTAAGGERCEH